MSRVGVHLALVVSVAALPLACGKRSDATPKADPVASASAAPSVEEDPATKKQVTRDDCTKWAAHGVDVVVDTVKESASGCPTEPRDGLVGKFEGQRVSIRDGAIESCAKHLGETYTVGDARCYMRSKNAKELVACKFGPMAPQDEDTDLGAMSDGIRKMCAKAAAAASASAAPPK